jgi:hypothetical protein
MHMTSSSISDLDRVKEWLRTGKLLRPRSGTRGDIVDLVRAVGTVCGAAFPDLSNHSRSLSKTIGQHEHIVFALIDGLGSQLLRDLSRGRQSFILEHVVAELDAVYPSTTAAALTSIGTGAYPSQHGINGWWVYFEEMGLIAEILPFVERFSKKPLLDFGANSEEIFLAPSILPRMRHQPMVITRNYIANSVYSRYWSGGSPSAGYERIVEGIDLAIQRVSAANSPTYTHLYLPQLDGACHQHGIFHADVQKVFDLLDNEMRRLHENLGGRARIVISADHGHVDRLDDRHLHHDDPLMDFLKCPPSGEPTVPVFHVRDGQKENFRQVFQEKFGDLFALLSNEELEALELVGPGKMNPAARRHFGDFIGVAPQPNTIHYLHPVIKPVIHVGVHAGLTPAEMRVPLALA